MEPYHRNNRILYVDDEGALLSAFVSLMRKEDVETHVLQDSTQIWSVLESDGPFAVVFSDQRMPVLDGVGVLEAVAHNHPSTIRVMVTGYADNSDTLRAINIAGIASYIPKPWKDDQIRQTSRECVERYNITEEKAHVSCTLASSHQSLEGLLERVAAEDTRQRRHAAETIKALVREKELMLKEIHHRVMNNLQVISSVLNLQAMKVPDASTREQFTRAAGRIRAMAMVHESLYASNDFSKIDFLEYLRVQMTEASSPSRRKGITWSVEGDQASLGIDIAVPLGMITHELITNALEYAFIGREKGSIRVTMRKHTGRALELRIEDDGVGTLDSPDLDHCEALGLSLVDTLVKQLGATIQRSEENGTRFLIRMVLPPPD